MTADQIGRYTILHKLGEGGMAAVYLAHDPEMERQVAIKVLARQFLNDSEFRARFKREARLIAALDHSAIVPIFDYGEANEQPYIAMRYLPGGTLAERLSGQPLSLEATLAIIDRLAQALDAAHKRGIIHRDLKPGNVLFDGEGYAFLSDFGIAKLAQGATAYTTTGLIGTPEYMSPEQAAGDKDLDARSDIYSLGVIAYQLLTGRKPFTGDTPMRVMYKHVHESAPPIDTRALGLPAKANGLMMRALAKKPETRYATAGELAAALRALLPASGKTRSPKPIPVPQTKPPAPRKEPTPTWRTGPRPAMDKTGVDRTTIAEPTRPALKAVPMWLVVGAGIGVLAFLGVALAAVAMLVINVGSTPTRTPLSTLTAPRTATRPPSTATARSTLRATATPTTLALSPTVEETATPTTIATTTRRAPANTPRPTTAPTVAASTATQLPPPTVVPPTNAPPSLPPPTSPPVIDTPTPFDPTATPVSPTATPVQDTPTPALSVEP